LYTYKQANAGTKSVLSFGRLSQTNMVLTQLVLIMETLIFSSRESTSITMRLLEVDMSHVLSSWILSQEPWTLSVQDLSVNYSDLTISFLAKLELVTTGQRVITLKALNSLTPFSTSLEKKLKAVIAFKVFKSLTLSVVEPVLVWEPS
jgi:hypothetical protein